MSLAEMSTAQGLRLQSPHSLEGGVWTRTPNLPPLNPASQGSGAS